MNAYRSEVKRPRGATATWVSPKVREPKGGFHKEKRLDKEMLRKRQAAGGGIPSGSSASQDKNWREAQESLFSFISKQ